LPNNAAIDRFMLDSPQKAAIASPRPLVTLAVVALWAGVWNWHARHTVLVKAAGAAAVCVVLQFAAGITLATFALPPPAQVAHLTLASLLLGAVTTVGLVAWRWPQPPA